MTTQDPNLAVRSLIIGAAPERRCEIEELWERYAPKIEVLPDRPGISMNATK